jgi:hypothetical protein
MESYAGMSQGASQTLSAKAGDPLQPAVPDLSSTLPWVYMYTGDSQPRRKQQRERHTRREKRYTVLLYVQVTARDCAVTGLVARHHDHAGIPVTRRAYHASVSSNSCVRCSTVELEQIASTLAITRHA